MNFFKSNAAITRDGLTNSNLGKTLSGVFDLKLRLVAGMYSNIYNFSKVFKYSSNVGLDISFVNLALTSFKIVVLLLKLYISVNIAILCFLCFNFTEKANITFQL